MKHTVRKRYTPGKILLLAAFLAAAAFLGVLMLHKYQERQHVPVHPVPVGTMQISLFFASDDASGLVPEGRKIEDCRGDLSACIRSTIEELANGPLGDLSPTIPDKSTIRSVQVKGDMAVVDLGQDFQDGIPKGSSAEMTAVYSIVNTISYNFPVVKRVQLLIEGRYATAPGSHLDLSKPLEPNFRLDKAAGNPSPDRPAARR
jgi:spore germination protein GerM